MHFVDLLWIASSAWTKTGSSPSSSASSLIISRYNQWGNFSVCTEIRPVEIWNLTFRLHGIFHKRKSMRNFRYSVHIHKTQLQHRIIIDLTMLSSGRKGITGRYSRFAFSGVLVDVSFMNAAQDPTAIRVLHRSSNSTLLKVILAVCSRKIVIKKFRNKANIHHITIAHARSLFWPFSTKANLCIYHWRLHTIESWNLISFIIKFFIFVIFCEFLKFIGAIVHACSSCLENCAGRMMRCVKSC